MHFLPFVSVILTTAVLVTSEPSDQLNSFEIAALNGDTLFTDTSNDGNLVGNLPSPPPTGNGVPGGRAAPQQPPKLDTDPRQQQTPPPGVSPYGQQQQNIPSDGSAPGRPQYGSPPSEQPREQTPIPEGSTSPPPGYQADQHCRQYGGCPFECHTGCVCWEWCKNAKCNLAVSGEQVLTPAQLSCDPSAGEKFIGQVCRPYCANWCEDMKNQILQSLPSDQQQRAFLSQPRECDKNYYLCPGNPNPSGLDCLTPPNPLDPGLGGQSGPSGSYGNQQQQRPQQRPQQQPQQQPTFGTPPGTYNKELDKTDASAGITEFFLDDSS